jgi:hypothetical protein
VHNKSASDSPANPTSGSDTPHLVNTCRYRNEAREPEDHGYRFPADHDPAVVHVGEEHGREEEVGEDHYRPHRAEDEEIGFGVVGGYIGAVGGETEDYDREDPADVRTGRGERCGGRYAWAMRRGRMRFIISAGFQLELEIV